MRSRQPPKPECDCASASEVYRPRSKSQSPGSGDDKTFLFQRPCSSSMHTHGKQWKLPRGKAGPLRSALLQTHRFSRKFRDWQKGMGFTIIFKKTCGREWEISGALVVWVAIPSVFGFGSIFGVLGECPSLHTQKAPKPRSLSLSPSPSSPYPPDLQQPQPKS